MKNGVLSSVGLTSLYLSGEEGAVVEWRADMTFLSEGVNLVGNARRFEGDETGVTEAITNTWSKPIAGSVSDGLGFNHIPLSLQNLRIGIIR